MSKKWYQSKTKLGAVIGGVGTALVSIGAWLQGNMDSQAAIQGIIVGISALLVGLGIRDAIEKIE